MIVKLKEPFKSAWRNKDPFKEARGQKGSVFRAKEGRRTLQFIFSNKSYFLKYHAGIGWKEIFKNVSQLRWPVLGASNEYLAALKLHSLGVDTLTPVAFGQRGFNPAVQESFLICEDLINTLSLEELCQQWQQQPPAVEFKQDLIKKVAQSARLMHCHGINHRDFYICHFLIPEDAQQRFQNEQAYACSLIDLHRCQIRPTVPRRWLIKDLAGLLYSVMDAGFDKQDIELFLKHYQQDSFSAWLKEEDFWREVKKKALALYQKDFGCLPKNHAFYCNG